MAHTFSEHDIHCITKWNIETLATLAKKAVSHIHKKLSETSYVEGLYNQEVECMTCLCTHALSPLHAHSFFADRSTLPVGISLWCNIFNITKPYLA